MSARFTEWTGNRTMEKPTKQNRSPDKDLCKRKKEKSPGTSCLHRLSLSAPA